MRVLVLAPVGRDADLLCSTMRKRDLECVAAHNAEQLVALIKEGAGAVLITEEVVCDTTSFRAIIAQIGREPEWSDLPVIALVSARAAWESFLPLDEELKNINLSVLERPARSETILRAVQSSLRARRRQYQVREFLADRLASQENLLRTQKLESIGLLAGGIAHDFNNLLTGIIGNASLLSATLPENSNEALCNAGILTAAERSAELTRQLLAYSGKGKFLIETVCIRTLIKETAQLIRASLPLAVTLRFNLDKTAMFVDGDRSQLQQVVMNLILNGGEAIPAGKSGAVIVASQFHKLEAGKNHGTASGKDLAPGSYIAVAVSDNGIGMSEITRAQVFEPFFSTKLMGRGLGLAAVRGIVEGHGGSVDVTSHLGSGTTFTVYLPVAKAANIEPATASVPSLISGVGHVLIADDETVVRTAAKTILEKLGYVVSLAHHGQQALEILERTLDPSINVLILDWMMPTMDGPAAFNRVRRDYPNLPVIISSGYSEEQSRASFPDSQVVGFLQKPFDAKQLSITVSRAIKQPGENSKER